MPRSTSPARRCPSAADSRWRSGHNVTHNQGGTSMVLSENGSPVSLRIAESVVEITLNRPPANALGMPIIDGLHIGLEAARALPATDFVVPWSLTGFCGGGSDINLMSSVDAASLGAYGDALRGAV